VASVLCLLSLVHPCGVREDYPRDRMVSGSSSGVRALGRSPSRGSPCSPFFPPVTFELIPPPSESRVTLAPVVDTIPAQGSTRIEVLFSPIEADVPQRGEGEEAVSGQRACCACVVSVASVRLCGVCVASVCGVGVLLWWMWICV
jgi:hypothetical protein